MKSYKKKIKIVFIIILLTLTSFRSKAEDNNYTLYHLLKLAKKNPVEVEPTDRIYMKNGYLYCTGQSEVALHNNKAVALMEKGKFTEASEVFEEGLKHSALFFPFRYNLGLSYVHTGKLKKAMLNFNKAKMLVPEFSETYMQIGYIYQRWYRDSEAIESYREALKRNREDLNTFIVIGNVFFSRNQFEMAKKYYDAALKIDHRYPNGLLGRAKIHFKQKEFIKAIVLLKSIDTSQEYDKSLHYYFAESAFKLQDYKTASKHYTILLENINDKFFLTNSASLIRHKLDLSNRFVELKQ
jgi:tetratricopeptide (TPR) repeat protein